MTFIEPGQFTKNFVDEDVYAIIDGACEELDMVNYASLAPLSLPCLERMQAVQIAACGECSDQVNKRVRERREELRHGH